MRYSGPIWGFLVVLVGLALLPGGSRAAGGEGLASADLSGNWYILIHYKDARSEDKSLTKFKDFAWAIEQAEKRVVIRAFPYVTFDEETELVRRHAMTEHLPWEPNAALWGQIREGIRVGLRGATKKRLKGSLKSGFSSASGRPMGGMNTLSFERNWKIEHSERLIRIQIVDTLSGSAGLEGMEDSILYEIEERVSPDEFRGRYAEGKKAGTFRMVRTRELRTE